MKYNKKRRIIGFFVTIVALVFLILFAIRTGSLDIGIIDLLKALFIEADEKVGIVVDLRLPRIIISVVGGFAIGVSGTLFQSVMKNPLADPGLLGVSSGASLTFILMIWLFPGLFFIAPLMAFIGGLAACFLVYSLAWKGGLDAMRIILVGIAVNAVFLALIETAQKVSAGGRVIENVVTGNLSFKNWNHVTTLVIYATVFIIIAFLLSSRCDIIAMDDRTIASLGMNVNVLKIQISVVAVFLAAISTVILGTVSFLGLLAPWIGRLVVGSEHKYLIPYSMLAGGFILLLADTVGRTVAYPAEISVGVIMAVVGGPFFIALLKRTGGKYAK